MGVYTSEQRVAASTLRRSYIGHRLAVAKADTRLKGAEAPHTSWRTPLTTCHNMSQSVTVGTTMISTSPAAIRHGQLNSV